MVGVCTPVLPSACSGQSLLERGEDEDAERGALAVSLRVLTEIHSRFFSSGAHWRRVCIGSSHSCRRPAGLTAARAAGCAAAEPGAVADVRHHLRWVRSQVLEGCCVLFSRIFPKDCTEPSSHPMWALAVKVRGPPARPLAAPPALRLPAHSASSHRLLRMQLGARCVTEPGDDVTHVVAGTATQKTQWAQEAGKLVVTPDWLGCCGKRCASACCRWRAVCSPGNSCSCCWLVQRSRGQRQTRRGLPSAGTQPAPPGPAPTGRQRQTKLSWRRRWLQRVADNGCTRGRSSIFDVTRPPAEAASARPPARPRRGARRRPGRGTARRAQGDRACLR